MHLIVCAIHIRSGIILSVFLRFTCIGSMGQLHFDLSIGEIKYRASRTILSDSPLARLFTGLMNVFLLGRCFLFTGEIIS